MVPVDKDQDVGAHVCMRGDTNCAQPVPKGLARLRYSGFGGGRLEHGPHFRGQDLAVMEEGANLVGKRHALLVCCSWDAVGNTVADFGSTLMVLLNVL